MPAVDDISECIRHLGDPDPRDRSEFALRLYRAGSELCRPLLDQWKTDPEFRDLGRTFTSATAHKTDQENPAIVVGIAVKPDHFERIRVANDSPRLANVPAEQGTKEFELHFKNHVALDILTAGDRGGTGPLARFLEKFGEGIQQVEVYVRDVDRATEILRTKFGLEPVYRSTHAGADGTRVNFFLTPTPEGKKVLIELVEPEDSSL
jgi:methylmalonyl-CoA/ethylmalonyl-CoA epimerase